MKRKMVFDDLDIAKFLHKLSLGDFTLAFGVDESPLIKFCIRKKIIAVVENPNNYNDSRYTITHRGLSRLNSYKEDPLIGPKLPE